MKILIVDDESSVAVSLASFFKRKYNIEPITAFSAKEAVALIKAHKPDILIVDLQLNDGSGFDVMRHANEVIPSSPIIVMTGLADGYLEVRSAMFQAEHFLQKPIEIEKLSLLVEKIIKEASLKSSGGQNA